MREDERWAAIPGRHGYEASTLGNVRSVDRIVRYANGRDRIHRGVPLKPRAEKRTGHLYVEVSGRQQYVHRLVLEAFVGPSNGLECCHWDGDPTNNQLTNLRWDTRAGNHRDRVRHGTHNWFGTKQLATGAVG